MWRHKILLASFLLPISLFAASLELPPSAWPASIVSEQDLPARYPADIASYYNTGVTRTFRAFDGLTLSYREFLRDDERAAIVLVPGRGESYSKYPELLYTLHQEGYSVYVLDLRSQGHSGRLSSNPKMIHVQNFQDYVRDLSLFVDGFVRSRPHRRVFALAHSMGGLIAAVTAEQRPWTFDGMVLSSPLMQINLRNIPEPVVYTILYSYLGTGKGAHYAWYQGNPVALDSIGDDNYTAEQMTHSAERFHLKLQQWTSDPATQMGGGSFRWLYTTLNATHEASKHIKKFLTPTLVFTAGRDVLAVPKGTTKFCKKTWFCSFVEYPNAFHEILMEKDSIRTDALLSALRFFDEPHMTGVARQDEIRFALDQIDYHLARREWPEAQVASEHLSRFFKTYRASVKAWQDSALQRAVQDRFQKAHAATMSADEQLRYHHYRWQEVTPVRAF